MKHFELQYKKIISSPLYIGGGVLVLSWGQVDILVGTKLAIYVVEVLLSQSCTWLFTEDL